MDVAAVFEELYSRIPALARTAVEGLDEADLARMPEGTANSIGWLVWHTARLQDHQISELMHTDQLWVTEHWAERFGMAADPDDMGYGHDVQQVASVRPGDPTLLLDYLAAAQARTESLLAGLDENSLDEIIDRNWDPPVTLGVRLVSVADDCLQHLGQAAYVRGLFGR